MIRIFKNYLAWKGLHVRRDGAHATVISISLMLILFTLSSCVYDDREDCEFPLRLHFTYLYNREGRDLFAEEVDVVTLSLYDTETGNFVKSTKITRADLDADGVFTWSAPAGRFSLVSWGGADKRHLVDMTGNISGHSASIHAETVPQMREHLWHNLTTDILINGTISPIYEIDLHKLSNDLLVRIHSSRDDDAYLAQSRISITNGRYDAFGNVVSPSPTTYLPLLKGAAESDRDNYGALATHDYTLLSLFRDDDSLLHITLLETKTTIYSGELSNLLAQRPGADLDLDDEWLLDFWLDGAPDGNISVSVSVNNWHVSDYTVILR